MSLPQKDKCNRDDEPIVFSKGLLDKLMKEDDYPGLLALYTFYYYTARWQKTNQIYATNVFAVKGTGIGICKIKRLKKRLKEMGLIKPFSTRDENGQITGNYVKVNFVWSKEKTKETAGGIENNLPAGGMENRRCGFDTTNALSTNSLNALSTNKDTPLFFEEGKAPLSIDEQTETIYRAYPKKVDKKDALKAIKKALKEVPYEELLEAVKAFAESPKVKATDKQYIKNPAPWFNKGSYLDDRTEWGYKPSPEKKPNQIDQMTQEQIEELKFRKQKIQEFSSEKEKNNFLINREKGVTRHPR